MNKEQREYLFIKWDLYSPTRKKKIITEYFANGGAYCQESWLDYLKDKLNREGYWKKNGLA
jgi:hypothetical protein